MKWNGVIDETSTKLKLLRTNSKLKKYFERRKTKIITRIELKLELRI